ncbi:aminotransferase [Candidatus Saccharibacteria bacterium QS_5_54_17]|nr:MAG: aminotransferase [Candidatus Saccharibacteria bacterium QS_5_54_17]
MIYLDYAAATPVDERVMAAMQPYWTEDFYNPSALYTAARQVKSVLHLARKRSGAVLGAKPGEIYFTAGATEANNIAIAGIMQRFPEKTMRISVIEHDSVRQPARAYGEHQEIGVGADGLLRPEDVEAAIDEDTVLISVEYVNSELGVIQPLRDVARLVSDIRTRRQNSGNNTPLYLHTDVSQAAGRLPLDVSELGVDMATINGGKIYGPKQSGLLYVRRGVELQPILYGGGQEGGIRTGTENVAFAVGTARALEIADESRSDEQKRLRAFQKRMFNCARQLGGVVNGDVRRRISDNVHVSFPGVDGETLVHHLDVRGICVATGSACQANNDTPDHVLLALGREDAYITGSLRLTFGRDTTADDIGYTEDVLGERIPQLGGN